MSAAQQFARFDTFTKSRGKARSYDVFMSDDRCEARFSKYRGLFMPVVLNFFVVVVIVAEHIQIKTLGGATFSAIVRLVGTVLVVAAPI